MLILGLLAGFYSLPKPRVWGKNYKPVWIVLSPFPGIFRKGEVMLWISGIKKARSFRKVSAHYSKIEVSAYKQNRSEYPLTPGKQGQTRPQAWFLRNKI
jgi:hypothetical protein